MVSLVVTGILIPKILLISFRKNLFDPVDERKIHHGTVPRLGGMAFMPAIMLSLAFTLGLNMLAREQMFVSGFTIVVGTSAIRLSFGMCAVMMLYLVGIADDLIGVKYRAKFVVQIVAAIMLVMSGLIIGDLHGLLGIREYPSILACILTVIVIVFIVNAINLIDGIDGLASGLSGIALITYGSVFISTGNMIPAIISFAALGTLVPFFYYNVFGDPAVGKKIFMGDTGSLTTGIVLSYLSIRLYISGDSVYLNHSGECAVWAFAPLLVPCLDVIRVFIHRIIRGRSPFMPDRVHIHHKLLALGMPQRVAMLMILLTSAVYVGINYALAYVGVNLTLIVALDVVLWVVANYFLTRAIHRRQSHIAVTEWIYD